MDLHELVKKKGGKKLDPKELHAKMGVLKEIADMAHNSMGDDLKGLQKVTVMAPDKDGVKMGLDKAKDMLNHDDLTDDTLDAAKNAETMHDDAGDSDDQENPMKKMSEGGEVDPSDDSGEHEEHLDAPADVRAADSDTDMLATEIEHETGEGDMSDDEIDDLIKLLESKKKQK